MIEHEGGLSFECVVVDLSTQIDFCDPLGADPVANLRDVVPVWRRMVAWTKRNRTPVISSLESHRPSETNGDALPNTCCDGSNGQRKIDFTIFRRSVNVEVDNTLWCPLDLYRKHQQIVFRKRTEDLFENPKADRFLTQLPVGEFILFGVGLETSIRTLALGLAARQKRVSVVLDACGYWNSARAELAERQMFAKGVNIITMDELHPRKLSRYGVPWLESVDASRPDTNGKSNDNGNGNGRANGKSNGHTGTDTEGNGHLDGHI